MSEQQPDPTLLDIHSGINELSDLFRRRLLSDRASGERERRLLDIVEGRSFDPFLKQLGLLIDRCMDYDRQIADGEYSFAASIVDELEQALGLAGVEIIRYPEPFDPHKHVAVSVETVESVTEPYAREVVSVGFIREGRVIAPASVRVEKPSADAGTSSTQSPTSQTPTSQTPVAVSEDSLPPSQG